MGGSFKQPPITTTTMGEEAWVGRCTPTTSDISAVERRMRSQEVPARVQATLMNQPQDCIPDIWSVSREAAVPAGAICGCGRWITVFWGAC